MDKGLQALKTFNAGTVKRWPSEKKGETFNFTETEANEIRTALHRLKSVETDLFTCQTEAVMYRDNINRLSTYETRAKEILHDLIPDIGHGDDPIGFILAAYPVVCEKLRAANVLFVRED